jgi:hypothetical protein
MKVSLVVVGVFAASAFVLTGCGLFSPDEDGSSQPAAISEFGGYSTSNESPAFGDAGLLAEYPEDQPFDDDMENDPEVRIARNDRGSHQYALRMIWGDIERRDSTTAASMCPVSDWSGAVVVDGGVVVVKRLILFDREDSIVRPRKDPHIVRWVSYTKDHVDGLLLRIIDAPDPRARATGNTLTIKTPFYTGEIPLSELADYREFVVYDECNAISIVATRIEPMGCPRGFLEGSWIADTDTSGYFRGVWIGNQGTLMGHLRGVYGLRGGERVVFGKWISTSGEFQGLLRGRWTPLDVEDGPDGVFEGRWVDEAFETRGYFKGHYAFCPGDTLGSFHGRWIKECK